MSVLYKFQKDRIKDSIIKRVKVKKHRKYGIFSISRQVRKCEKFNSIPVRVTNYVSRKCLLWRLRDFFFYHENVLCPLLVRYCVFVADILVLSCAILRKKTERTVNCCFWRKNNRPVFRAVTCLILCFSIAVVAVVGIFCSILVRQVIFDPLCHHKR